MPRTPDRDQPLHETEPQGPVIERLCAAVKMPWFRQSEVLFFGWSADGKPTIVGDDRYLSRQAFESYRLTEAVDFPFGREQAGVAVVPMEFVSTSRPIDRQDPRAEDILVYGVKGGDKELTLIRIEELDLLEAIIHGHVVWEDVNPQTVFAQETLPALKMHMMMIPARTERDERVVYALMFAPVMENESNEVMFQQFLVQTLKSLIALDEQQDSEDKRGYEQAAATVVNQNLSGNDAYVVMKALKYFGLVDMSDEALEDLKAQSSGKGFGYQLLLLAEQAGLVNIKEERPSAKQKVEQFTVEELMKFISLAYRLARRSIG